MNWLIDVIALDIKTAAGVIGNFQQVVKEGELRLPPTIARLVDKDVLQRMVSAEYIVPPDQQPRYGHEQTPEQRLMPRDFIDWQTLPNRRVGTA